MEQSELPVEITPEIRFPSSTACSLERLGCFRSKRNIDIYVARYGEYLCALKILSASKASFQSMICSDVRYLKALEHRNVAKYFGLELNRKLAWYSLLRETDSTKIGYFLTVRYYPGNDLSLWAEEFRQTSPNHRCIQRFLCDLLQGLHYLHSHQLQIIHCDIKPANLVLHSSSSRIIIIDFDGVAFSKNLQTEDRTVAFTPYYAAPELLLSMMGNLPIGKAAEIGGKIDIWSVGCVAIQLCTGMTPSIRKNVDGIPGAPLQTFPAITCNLASGKARPEIPDLDECDPWNRRLVDFITECLEFNTDVRKSAEQLLCHDYITTSHLAP